MPKERSFVTSKRSYAFQKRRQEDRKFEAKLSYIVSSRPVWAAQEARFKNTKVKLNLKLDLCTKKEEVS